MKTATREAVASEDLLSDAELLNWEKWEIYPTDMLGDHFCAHEFKSFEELFEESLRVFRFTMLGGEKVERESLAWALVWNIAAQAYYMSKGDFP